MNLCLAVAVAFHCNFRAIFLFSFRGSFLQLSYARKNREFFGHFGCFASAREWFMCRVCVPMSRCLCERVCACVCVCGRMFAPIELKLNQVKSSCLSGFFFD